MEKAEAGLKHPMALNEKSKCSSFDLCIQTYRDLAECSDAKHVLCHWRKWLFVAEGYQGIDAGCAASRDVARYQGDEEEQ